MTRAGPERSLVILLSTYNGERFIAEQIESIRRQTITRWTLLVRDDGSSDRTLEIVERLAASDPRIRLLPDGRGNLGAARSFGALMEAAVDVGADYVAFADQDDVWREDKLAHDSTLLGELEAAVGSHAPLLVHSDLMVVDEQLRLIHPSFLAFQGLRYDPAAPLRVLLVQNVVTGCACMANLALLRAALPLPRVIMHDWWLALVAGALGGLRGSPAATVRYRQHGGNAAGGAGRVRAGLEALRHPVRWWRRSQSGFSASLAQAADLQDRVERERPSDSSQRGDWRTVQAFLAAFSPESGPLRRLRAVRRIGVRPASSTGWPIFFWIRVLLYAEQSAEIIEKKPRPAVLA